ncbi:hypothetical protein BXOR1_07710 [Xanthomonas oryzae pv. oryzicola]|nr:hypothetical protein BE73_18185 [Xanthomonas oryzae pv. oryzicola]KOR45655.1 hypothetical protein ADT27_12795 [Xanthomonas oryzae]AKK65064.1 hypothetical protein FE36_15275 [Xanthomonas oryzae pv. oryzicola]AKN99924.1 hypothetical protein ACU15_04710 [Xanthomonas oryzae pv. oryzicola]AKO03670.1 hypothetical protein ACU16_05315 [Xanthomonas oryzae pv. oryzicola]
MDVVWGFFRGDERGMRAPCRSRLRFPREIAAPALTGQSAQYVIALRVARRAVYDSGRRFWSRAGIPRSRHNDEVAMQLRTAQWQRADRDMAHT